MKPPSFFVTGGALQVDASCYVGRKADTELLEALQRGEFCYVLTSRQMGKSSLMVRTAATLRGGGCAVVILDLTAIGQNLDVEQWYFSMLCHVGEKLNLERELEAYWDANDRRAPLHRFFAAIREVYLERKRKPLVIFVDEIDAVRSLRNFSADEFFAGIRECYNRRPEDPKFERLTFCLLGVATPSDLIRDERITPFNIGHAVELGDFTETDAAALAGGLSPHRETARLLLGRVLWWTGGQPYLTQKLCADVAKADADTEKDVDGSCERIFLSAEARERDDNLHFVRDRLLRSELDRAALLDGYAKVCRAERVADDHLNPVINELRLSGVVRVVDGCLQPRNRIYSRVFDRQWVRNNLPDAESRRQRAAYYRGIRRVVGVAIVVLAIMGFLAVSARRSANAEKVASHRAKEAFDAEKVASQRAKQAFEDATNAAERERRANADKIAEAGRTKAALNRLVETQSKVEALLEALTPLVGNKSGTLILDRAEDVVRGVTNESADDPRLVLGLAGLRRVCGRLYLRLGNEEKALLQGAEARRLLETELQRGNSDPALEKQLHDCIQLLGDTLLGGRAPDTSKRKTEADYNRAIAAYREAMERAQAEVAARPDDAVWRAQYFADLLKLGDTARLFNRLKLKEAETLYTDALRAMAEMRQRTPAAADLGWIEASIHDRLGTLFLDENRKAEARKHFDRSLILRQSETSAEIADDPERQSDLAMSYNKLGNFFNDQGQWKEALEYYQRGLTIRRKLCDQNKQREWQRNLGFSLHNVSRIEWKLGGHKRALELSRERLTLTETLLAEDPSDAYLKLDYANALYAYADILLNVSDNSLKDWPRALELAQSAVRYTERRDARSLALLAQALRFAKRAPEALGAAEEAAKLLPPKEKRTTEENAIADEIAYELNKGRSARR